MTGTEDVKLVREFLAGDQFAFGSLIQRYQKPIFNLIFGMVNHYDDACDLTQQAFAKAASKIDQFDQRHRFFSWLYRIAVNESLNFLERSPRFETLDELQTAAANPEKQLMADEFETHLRKALAQLAPHYQAVILLKHFVDCSYQEISEALRIPESTVKSRLFVGRRLLWEDLKTRGLLHTYGHAAH